MTFRNALRKLCSQFSTTPASQERTAKSISATASPRISLITSPDQLPPEIAAALANELGESPSATSDCGCLEHYGRDMIVNVWLARALPDEVLTVVADAQLDEGDAYTFYRGGVPRLKVPKCIIYTVRWTEWASPNRVEML